MELVYGAISTTFFTLMLIGTLIYKSRRGGGGGGKVKTDFKRDTAQDADAEEFLAGILDERSKTDKR